MPVDGDDPIPAPAGITSPPVSAALAGLKGRCPRCGTGRLFARGLSMRERCDSCGLGFGFIDTGDGPAVFAIFILGAVMFAGALVAEFKFKVSVWTHVVLWGVLMPVVAFGLLRWLKGTLVALQYRHKAEEARLAKE
jgi:uncharacterized protein (DUF983 family)